MKFFPVTPMAYHPLIKRMGIGGHLVDAAIAIRDKEYLRSYSYMGTRGHFIMVDNGAYEEYKRASEGLDFPEILSIANEIQADEIILPDRLFNSSYTIANTLKWGQTIPRQRRAVCPQGSNWEDWEHCLDVLIARMEFNTLCLTKALEEFPGGRVAALRTVMNRKIQTNVNIHILGLSSERSVEKELMLLKSEYSGIRSVDSSKPFSYAQHDVDILDFQVRLPLNWNAEKEEALAFTNILTLIGFCNARNV